MGRPRRAHVPSTRSFAALIRVPDRVIAIPIDGSARKDLDLRTMCVRVVVPKKSLLVAVDAVSSK